MIKKIIIDNFMAHERTELELGPGVTALTGSNNTGKSAIVEALRCVVTNPTPKHYIRHGAKEARVTVELEDGTKVVWIRKPRSSGYELWSPGAEEPQEYWKFGRKPPEDVLKVLRLDLVELETGGEVDVHVGNQREPVFLLNQPASNAAAFFAASTESAHLLAMQNLLKRRMQDAKRQERDLNGRVSQIEAEIDKFSSLPDIEIQTEIAQELERTAKKLQSEIPALESLLSTEVFLSKSIKSKRTSAAILKGTTEPPKLNQIGQLDEIVNQLEVLNHNVVMARKTSEVIAPLVSVPEVFDTKSLIGLCAKTRFAQEALGKAEVRVGVLAELSAPVVPETTLHLAELIDKIFTARCRADRYSRWENVLQNVVEPPTIYADTELVQLLVSIREQSARQGQAQTSLAELEKRIQSVEEEIATCIESLGCCPTCGGDLKTEAFIDRGCRHDA